LVEGEEPPHLPLLSQLLVLSHLTETLVISTEAAHAFVSSGEIRFSNFPKTNRPGAPSIAHYAMGGITGALFSRAVSSADSLRL
jgi:hypothetical protein